MLSFPTPSVYQSSKCFVTYGVMGHLDPNQPPTKSKPWSTVAGQDFINRVCHSPPCWTTFTNTYPQVELIIPQESFEVVRKILNEKAAPEFKRVVMSLHDVLSGDFFIEYIKKGSLRPLFKPSQWRKLTRYALGNVMMLSEGRKGIDNVFTFRNGTPRSNSKRVKTVLNALLT